VFRVNRPIELEQALKIGKIAYNKILAICPKQDNLLQRDKNFGGLQNLS
jgi:hypothetical protein